MKDMQAQLAKIRSDAAECLLLGTIGTNEKKEMFVRMAEHLNGLALEIEKSMTNSANEKLVAPQPETIVRALTATDKQGAIVTHSVATEHQKPSSSRRVFLSLTVIIAMVAVGSFFWSDNRVADDLSLLFAWRTQHLATPHEDLPQAIAAFAPGEQKTSNDQLTALDKRVANLESALETLKIERKETVGASSKGSSAEQSPLAADSKGSTSEDKSSPNETNSISPRENASAAKPSDSASAATGNALGRMDRVGPMVITGGIELDRRRAAIGPLGCTKFRSFDPVSGTYMTLDGRRRPCN